MRACSELEALPAPLEKFLSAEAVAVEYGEGGVLGDTRSDLHDPSGLAAATAAAAAWAPGKDRSSPDRGLVEMCARSTTQAGDATPDAESLVRAMRSHVDALSALQPLLQRAVSGSGGMEDGEVYQELESSGGLCEQMSMPLQRVDRICRALSIQLTDMEQPAEDR